MAEHFLARTFTVEPGENPHGRCRAMALCACGTERDGWGNVHRMAFRQAENALAREHIYPANEPVLEKMAQLADEIEAPLICREPAYGVPGHAHCAACCGGTGYVITNDEDQAMLDLVHALRRAVRLISTHA